jgi:phosphoheptose isomerase
MLSILLESFCPGSITILHGFQWLHSRAIVRRHTAVGNDYAYEHVFERQIRGLARPNDTLIALLTSGRSPNIVRALVAARGD